ncbi:hypothetical protein Tco_1279519, partial [Tanacetum coccineum]
KGHSQLSQNDSSALDYDLAVESSVYDNSPSSLEKLEIFEPISELRDIKSILKSKSTFKPSSIQTKDKQVIVLASADKLNFSKMEHDLPLACVIKDLNDLKAQVSKCQSLEFRNKRSQQVLLNTLQSRHITHLKKECELCGLNNHNTEKCYKVLFYMKCKRTDHRKSDHAKFMSTINMTRHLNSLGRSSQKPKIPRPSKCFFPPCTHCGSIDHLSNDCLYYPICRICGSYDHETNGHNRIISLKRETNSRNPQHPFKRCEVCSNSIHITTDHYDIEWFKRGEALQAKKAEEQKKTSLSYPAPYGRIPKGTAM